MGQTRAGVYGAEGKMLHPWGPSPNWKGRGSRASSCDGRESGRAGERANMAKRRRTLVISPDFISYHSLHDSKETLDDFLYRAIAGRNWGDCRSDVELLLRDNGDDSAFPGICRCLRFSA
jgi:hypothetical protein